MASRLEYIQYISIALLLLAIDVYFLFCAVIYGNLNLSCLVYTKSSFMHT